MRGPVTRPDTSVRGCSEMSRKSTEDSTCSLPRKTSNSAHDFYYNNNNGFEIIVVLRYGDQAGEKSQT